MPVETDADRAVFLNDDEFAQTVIWPSSCDPIEIPAIFDADYALLTTPLLETGSEGSQPMFICRTSDVPGDAANGDTVQIDGCDYRVVEMKPDGTGMTTVRLQEG